ncbi:hypothetical protein ACFL1N_17080, partial [Thermodesulfobacteriota bacterium]
MKKNIVIKIGLIVGLLILNSLIYSCVTTQTPVSQLGIYNSSHGFSVQLPSGNTWEIKKQGNATLSYKKLTPPGFHSFFAIVEEFVLEHKFRN